MPVIYPQLDGVRINDDRSLPIALIQAIRKAYDYLAALNAPALPTAAAQNPATSGVTYLTDVTLTAPVTTVNAPAAPADGAFWVARIKQDATGGRAVSWAGNIQLAPIIDATFNSAASTMCIIVFTGIGPNWYVSGMPILATAIV